jgi:CRISPR/Cas system-associated exonuclease Cas4 (RecB family)
MAVTSWSHSKLVDFEKCKKMFWLKHDQKIPEPERPLPPGKLEHANDRGTRIHQSCEDYVNGTSAELCWEAEKHFGPELDLLRVLHAQGMVSLEGEWAMDNEWVSAAWKTGWLRLKLDAIVHLSKQQAIVIDYKSGKKFGNEIKHGEQLQLYALVSFLRYPELEHVTAELWYVDQNEVTTLRFTRDQALRFRPKWDSRGHKITSCTDFPANPNVFSCKWCPYGPAGTGHCAVGKQ